MSSGANIQVLSSDIVLSSGDVLITDGVPSANTSDGTRVEIHIEGGSFAVVGTCAGRVRGVIQWAEQVRWGNVRWLADDGEAMQIVIDNLISPTPELMNGALDWSRLIADAHIHEPGDPQF